MSGLIKDRESDFQVDELFFSVTDLKGLILSGNEVFVRVSQFTWPELDRKPHNIIRHPDMPKVVFRLLWQTIQSEKPIGAYVKNKSKDGSYYWVYALVIPLGDRYLSMRLKPTSDTFKAIPSVYAKLLEIEKKSGVDAAQTELLNVLKSLGFQNYEEFMDFSLRKELECRDKAVRDIRLSGAPVGKSQSNKISAAKGLETLLSSFQSFFNMMEDFNRLSLSLKEQRHFFKDFASRIRFMSMNVSVGANRLGSDGRTLAVVAQQVQQNARDSQTAFDGISTTIDSAVNTLRDAGFGIGTSKLEIELIKNFLNEAAAGQFGGRNFESVQADLELLLKIVTDNCKKSLKFVSELYEQIRSLRDSVHLLDKTIETVGIVHLTGRIETTLVGDDGEFKVRFSELEGLVREARERLRGLLGLIDSLISQINRLNQDQHMINLNIESLSSIIQTLKQTPISEGMVAEK